MKIKSKKLFMPISFALLSLFQMGAVSGYYSTERAISTLEKVNQECDRELLDIKKTDVGSRIVPMYQESETYSVAQLSDTRKFSPNDLPVIQEWERLVYSCYQRNVEILENSPIGDKVIPYAASILRASTLVMSKLVSGAITYGERATEITVLRNQILEDLEKDVESETNIIRQQLLARQQALAAEEMSSQPEKKGFLSMLGDALLYRIANGGSGRRTWMFDGVSNSSTSSCRSLNDFSGRIYSFQGACPVGYSPVF
jgi:hypothetical protein